MKNLKPLSRPAIEFYDEITQKKHQKTRNLLENLRPNVLSRYEEYAKKAPEIQNLAPTNYAEGNTQAAAGRKAFLDAYQVPTAPLNQLRILIKESQEIYGRSICAYCGINNPAQTEHYLPESLYPEFSVCCYNLIPSCGECNNIKLVKLFEGSQRIFIHFYYDRIVKETQWLFANIRIIENTPHAEFSLKKPRDISDDSFELISRHYSSLRLTDRYSAKTAEIFSEMMGLVSPESAQDDLIRTLKSMGKNYAREHGINYWKAVLYEAVANSTDGIKYIFDQSKLA